MHQALAATRACRKRRRKRSVGSHDEPDWSLLPDALSSLLCTRDIRCRGGTGAWHFSRGRFCLIIACLSTSYMLLLELSFPGRMRSFNCKCGAHVMQRMVTRGTSS